MRAFLVEAPEKCLQIGVSWTRSADVSMSMASPEGPEFLIATASSNFKALVMH